VHLDQLAGNLPVIASTVCFEYVFDQNYSYGGCWYKEKLYKPLGIYYNSLCV